MVNSQVNHLVKLVQRALSVPTIRSCHTGQNLLRWM